MVYGDVLFVGLQCFVWCGFELCYVVSCCVVLYCLMVSRLVSCVDELCS